MSWESECELSQPISKCFPGHTLTKYIPKAGLPDVMFEWKPTLGLWEHLPDRGKVTLILKNKAVLQDQLFLFTLGIWSFGKYFSQRCILDCFSANGYEHKVGRLTLASVTLNSLRIYCGMLYSAMGSTTKYWYLADRSAGQYWWHFS